MEANHSNPRYNINQKKIYSLNYIYIVACVTYVTYDPSDMNRFLQPRPPRNEYSRLRKVALDNAQTMYRPYVNNFFHLSLSTY